MRLECTNTDICGWAGEGEDFLCPVCWSLALPSGHDQYNNRDAEASTSEDQYDEESSIDLPGTADDQ